MILSLTETVVILNCQRTGPHDGTIELVSSALTGSKSKQVALDDVVGVAIKPGLSRGAGGVVLRTREGEFSLAVLSSGRANQLASDMGHFIYDTADPVLTIRQDERAITYGVSSGVLAVGLFIIALGFQVVACTFDKSTGRVEIRRKSPFGTKKVGCALADVADMRVEVVGSRKRARVAYLIMRSGERIHAGWPDQSNTIGSVRAFLGMSG
ncbi:MAG TPA: hypothetical protein VEZ90_02300 [Blastocatellia bacterium]|nr:hypothetical protein [Blastocatellia bacterium]